MLSELRRLAPVSNMIDTLRVNRAPLFYFPLFPPGQNRWLWLSSHYCHRKKTEVMSTQMVPFTPFAWDQVQHIDDHGINIKYVGKYISVENVFLGSSYSLRWCDDSTHTHLVLVVQELFRGKLVWATNRWNTELVLGSCCSGFFSEQELCI